MEEVLGADFYFVHFNRQPASRTPCSTGTPPASCATSTARTSPGAAGPGMALIELARAEAPRGEP
ncbi:hypothetical protein GCM10020229_23980 [Kitasatospora albolonga]